jgi:hypothetical protein
MNLKLLDVLTAVFSFKAGCRKSVERQLQQSRCIYVCKCVIETVPTKGLSGVSPPRKFNGFLASQIPRIVWNPKFHYRIHKSTPLVNVLNQTDTIHTVPAYFFKIYFNVILPSMPRSSKWSLYFYFPTETLCISRFPCSQYRDQTRFPRPDLLYRPLSLLFSDYWGTFLGLKRPWREVNHPHPSSAKVKNEWICTSARPLCLHTRHIRPP